jgi:hypothetical protein
MVRELRTGEESAMQTRITRLARLFITVLVSVGIGLDSAPARAHGEPEKVVDGRFVVSLVLVPEADATRFRFAFRDFRTGTLLAEPVQYYVTIREEHDGEAIYESPELVTATGIAEVRYRVPRDGFYETLLEFRHPAARGPFYRAEDWYLWIPARVHRGHGVPWVVLVVLVLALATVWWWRRTAVRRQRQGPRAPGDTTTKRRIARAY